MEKLLLCIDFINDIVNPGGKLASKGYARFIERHNTLVNVAKAQDLFRRNTIPLVHVKVGFSPSYVEHPPHSPLFGKIKDAQALTLGSWGTEFDPHVGPGPHEPVIIKHRVNAFYGTELDLILRVHGIRQLYIAGVATDLAVESTAREAHDRDYNITILSDCCIAANDDDHSMSLAFLQKIAHVTPINSINLEYSAT